MLQMKIEIWLPAIVFLLVIVFPILLKGIKLGQKPKTQIKSVEIPITFKSSTFFKYLCVGCGVVGILLFCSLGIFVISRDLLSQFVNGLIIVIFLFITILVNNRLSYDCAIISKDKIEYKKGKSLKKVSLDQITEVLTIGSNIFIRTAQKRVALIIPSYFEKDGQIISLLKEAVLRNSKNANIFREGWPE